VAAGGICRKLVRNPIPKLVPSSSQSTFVYSAHAWPDKCLQAWVALDLNLAWEQTPPAVAAYWSSMGGWRPWSTGRGSITKGTHHCLCSGLMVSRCSAVVVAWGVRCRALIPTQFGLLVLVKEHLLIVTLCIHNPTQ
jgi:hypothetical protein